MKRLLSLFLALALPAAGQSLVFGGATSHRVNVTQNATIDSLDPFTYCTWIYPTTITDQRYIIGKLNTSNGRHLDLHINGAAGDILAVVDRTTPVVYTATGNPLATTNKWYFACVTFNSAGAAGSLMHLYVGDLETLAVDVSVFASDGSGAYISDANGPLIIGNNRTNLSSFQGRIATSQYVAAELTLGQIRALQFRPRSIEGTRLLTRLGANGTSTQADLSGKGNAGTVTGATLGAGLGIAP